MRNVLKRLLLVLPFLVCLLALSACDVKKMSSLPELSKPYVGAYQCEKLTLGGKDLLDRFEKIELKLGYGGEFELTYLDKNGTEGSYQGEYTVSPDAGNITLSAKTGSRSVTRTFRMDGGGIVIDANVLGKLLYAEFRLP